MSHTTYDPSGEVAGRMQPERLDADAPPGHSERMLAILSGEPTHCGHDPSGKSAGRGDYPADIGWTHGASIKEHSEEVYDRGYAAGLAEGRRLERESIAREMEFQATADENAGDYAHECNHGFNAVASKVLRQWAARIREGEYEV